jgi:hypothetical protein
MNWRLGVITNRVEGGARRRFDGGATAAATTKAKTADGVQ